MDDTQSQHSQNDPKKSLLTKRDEFSAKQKRKRDCKKIIIGILILLALVSGYFFYSRQQLGNIFVLSVSSDGNYVISTDDKRRAVLWNVKNKTYEILDHTANVYSAYFIKNTNYLMWQHDANNEVRITTTNAEVVQKFNPRFPTYGQVMTTDLKNYFASDEDWNLYQKSDAGLKQIEKGVLSFIGSGKLLNLMLSESNQFLLTSGYGGNWYGDTPLNEPNGKTNLNEVVLWSVSTGKPLIKFVGNTAKTFATLSPDGRYAVGGYEGSAVYIWETSTGKKLLNIDGIFLGKYTPPKDPNGNGTFDKTGIISIPKDFVDQNGNDRNDSNLSIKFIDQTHYLRFITYIPYAILYSITDPKPLKYLKLNTTPYPSIDDYSRDQSIDTSPSAHILVIGHRDVPGITVYQYDPKTETLKMIWNVS